MTFRYALYYAPPPDGPLERFGTTWLGRHHATGETLPQPSVPGIEPDRVARLTASPRRYGFHSTLKAPFCLATGRRPPALHDAVAEFAGTLEPFTLPPLVVGDLKGFIALVPSAPAPKLDQLAADCVRTFDAWRAPMTNDERARRLKSPLTARQLQQLESFGYPYVLDDFSFHMTLTERLGAADKAVLLPYLRDRSAEIAAKPFVVDAIAIFEQPTPGAAFVMTARYGFTSR